MSRLGDEKIVKLCPQCGVEMWVVDIATFGRLWLCKDCEVAMLGERLYKWREQLSNPEPQINVKSIRTNKHMSTKPCPECGKPMWAIVEQDYGTRHQCEDCRLTVMFGGGISRWRNIPKNVMPDDIEAT
ncbi:MAG: hypothetical protein QOG54_2849 [Actinomycetota bacterium]|jgi:ssDNA-binding Zn-finger/Zn-ribbon topoisomerase 1|nr:hypothetical protein [Actinomycetota bacterium]